MTFVFILIILLLIIDVALNEGVLFKELSAIDYPIPILLKLLLAIIAILAIVLLIYAVIMEWNLLPKLKPKKSLFEIEKDKEKHSSKKSPVNNS
ncbi:MAG TPA: hypothetical protein PKJ08_02300 [Candidatus Cloacimonadota bacterium]|jgi:uncharacterized membrane protein YcjF (UPF0283 family)|nr:hypothetical protein [Candidatus Cloacimonadota bacterium]HOD53335.1 hypothetical protein [Candidatus Cloacimonadota bacterium]HPM00956.1 hypothetical protein [Candidatus Cloacimonadota bacterium]